MHAARMSLETREPEADPMAEAADEILGLEVPVDVDGGRDRGVAGEALREGEVAAVCAEEFGDR